MQTIHDQIAVKIYIDVFAQPALIIQQIAAQQIIAVKDRGEHFGNAGPLPFSNRQGPMAHQMRGEADGCHGIPEDYERLPLRLGLPLSKQKFAQSGPNHEGTNAMSFAPYIGFDGCAREAMTHYAQIFGAAYLQIMGFSDSPKGQRPPSTESLVMHSQFLAAPSAPLPGCDIPPGFGTAGMGGSSVFHAAADVASARRIFAAL